jgi:hypothetical protein
LMTTRQNKITIECISLQPTTGNWHSLIQY